MNISTTLKKPMKIGRIPPIIKTTYGPSSGTYWGPMARLSPAAATKARTNVAR
jgi:hypothetical protein